MKRRKKENTWKSILGMGSESFLAGLFVLVCSLAVSWACTSIFHTSDSGNVEIVVWIEGVVGAVSTGFVVFQLKSGEASNVHQTAVEEAEFVLEYNKSFIENEKLTEIERYLECRISGADFGKITHLSDYRQEIVNYLVYLEGFASCVFSGVVDICDIDDLFAYRFFLAMNHPEVQSVDLLPYRQQYRGCFLLYDMWLKHRKNSEVYKTTKDYSIPSYDTALCFLDGYEEIVYPDIALVEENCEQPKGSSSIKKTLKTAVLNPKKREKEWVELSWEETKPGEGLMNLRMKASKEQKRHDQLRLMALKKLVYHNNVQKVPEVTDKSIQTELKWIIDARNALYQEGAHYRQLSNRLRLTDENLERIALLIYQTDPHIFPDMFRVNMRPKNGENNAVKILVELFKSGKDKMFNLDNLFVCEVREEIVGILLWYEGELDWSSSELEKVAEDKGILLPSTLNDVKAEYTSADGFKSHNIHIWNFCIDANARRFGIGRKLLTQFLSAHEGKVFELCVLKNNTSAVKLYQSCGFTVEGEEQAYPKTKIDHQRLLMSTLLPKYYHKEGAKCLSIQKST